MVSKEFHRCYHIKKQLSKWSRIQIPFKIQTICQLDNFRPFNSKQVGISGPHCSFPPENFISDHFNTGHLYVRLICVGYSDGHHNVNTEQNHFLYVVNDLNNRQVWFSNDHYTSWICVQ